MKFSAGEQVLAKMPSTDDYQKARVLKIKGSKYKVLFKGGEEHTVKETDVKVIHTLRPLRYIIFVPLFTWPLSSFRFFPPGPKNLEEPNQKPR
jgi:hypothetical protein